MLDTQFIGRPTSSKARSLAWLSITVVLVGLFCSVDGYSTYIDRKVKLIPLASSEGQKRLSRSESRIDFFKLVGFFEPQANKVFCGATASTIVLNALRLGKNNPNIPKDEALIDKGDRDSFQKIGVDPVFTRYTQNTFFNAQTDRIKARSSVVGAGGKELVGLKLKELGEMLKTHELKVEILPVDSRPGSKTISITEMREKMIRNLKTAEDYIIVNYFRPALGQPGGGHISPIAAYDRESDSFLIMDVNPNAAPWVWVAAASLYHALDTDDGGTRRGFLQVSDLH